LFYTLVARGMSNIIWLGFLTYNSIIVVQLLGGTPTETGVLAAVGSLAYASAATQTGRISALFDSRLSPLVGANVGLSAGFTVVMLAPSLSVALLGIAVAGCCFGIIFHCTGA